MFVSIPIAWGRLQFKYATANNGRRKGLQQHYRIQITLMAKLEGDGQLIKLHIFILLLTQRPVAWRSMRFRTQ